MRRLVAAVAIAAAGMVGLADSGLAQGMPARGPYDEGNRRDPDRGQHGDHDGNRDEHQQGRHFDGGHVINRYVPIYRYVPYYTPNYVAPYPTYWYYCPSAGAYYPYVSYCPDAWVPVPAG